MTLPDFPIMAGSLKPSGSAIQVEGGFRVSGHWAWGSGVEHADYVIVPVLSSDQTGLITAVVPQSQVRIIDNWHALGINGSGSSDYALDNVFVPEHFAITKPGHRRGGAIFRMGYGFAANEHAIFALALAQLALDSFIASAQKRGYGKGAVADREIVQRVVAEAELRLRHKLLMTDVLERLFAASADQEAPIALQAEAGLRRCSAQTRRSYQHPLRYAGGTVMLTIRCAHLKRPLYGPIALDGSDAAREALGKLWLSSPITRHALSHVCGLTSEKLICVDWGTTNLRAYAIGENGSVM